MKVSLTVTHQRGRPLSYTYIYGETSYQPFYPFLENIFTFILFLTLGYKYIMPITKINKECDFTPWEEESINIMRLVSSPTLKRTPKRPSKTITSFAGDHSASRVSKKSIERAYLSLTKINFYHPPSIATRPSTPQKHYSFKYEGPRLNFYLSMNPKQLRLSGEPRLPLQKIERESLVSTNTSSQPAECSTYRTAQHDEKGLKKNPSYSQMQLIGNANNIKRMKDQHRNMRKLKILYHCRGLKKTL